MSRARDAALVVPGSRVAHPGAAAYSWDCATPPRATRDHAMRRSREPDEEPDIDDESSSTLDEEFPLGDGTADDGAIVYCPYCEAPNELAIDAGGGAKQEYEEDCQVCCRTLMVVVHYRGDGSAEVDVETVDGA